jgi:hypothetical protein
MSVPFDVSSVAVCHLCCLAIESSSPAIMQYWCYCYSTLEVFKLEGRVYNRFELLT